MKKMSKIILLLFATFVAIGVVSCSGDSPSLQNSRDTFAQTFEGMKGNYIGHYQTPFNTTQNIKYSIDKNAKVSFSSVPIEQVLYKLCGNDYQQVRLNDVGLSFTSPIDSVGYNSGYIAFKTANDLTTNRVDFSFTDQGGMTHEGYMLVTIKGLYNPLQKIIDTNFIVTDLILDNSDYTSTLCPIENVFVVEQTSGI